MAIEGLSSFGLRLRYAREELRRQKDLPKITQPELAKAIGVQQSSISDWETGETKEISGPNLISLARALHVRAEWLMTGDEPIEPSKADDIKKDEGELIELYRGASGMWRVVIQRVAAMRLDEERERTAAFVLTSSFGKAVPDDRLGDNWTRPDKPKDPK